MTKGNCPCPPASTIDVQDIDSIRAAVKKLLSGDGLSIWRGPTWPFAAQAVGALKHANDVDVNLTGLVARDGRSPVPDMSSATRGISLLPRASGLSWIAKIYRLPCSKAVPCRWRM